MMNNRTYLFAVLMAAAVSLLIHCSSSDTVSGGGSDMPNSRVALVSGTITAGDTTVPAANIPVYLRSIAVDSSGRDSVVTEYETSTDTLGNYAFRDIPRGRYIILCESASTDCSAIDYFVDLSTDSADSTIDLTLRETVTLRGHIVLPPGLYYSKTRVFIPGTQSATFVNSRKEYTLEKVPVGRYDICFSYEGVHNLLQVDVHPHPATRTVALYDIQFAFGHAMGGDSTASFHHFTGSRSFRVTPKNYEPEMEPGWYADIDRSSADYFFIQADTLIRWDENVGRKGEGYDFTLSGVLYRDATGSWFIETVFGDIYEVYGAMLTTEIKLPQKVVAAVNRKEKDNGTVTWQIVDLYPFCTGEE